MSPLVDLYAECARNVCAVLAMDEEGDHEVSDLVARAVAHRQRTFPEWYALDVSEARREVGRMVADWLRGRKAA